MSVSAIDLSRLAVPDAIEPLDTEAAIAAIKARVLALAPELADTLALESETAVKLIEALAWFGTLHRARVNDGVRAVMLATATGADLENLAALFGVARLTIRAADPEARPPLAAVLETDAELRARTQLALEGFSVAGPRGAYRFHALSASGEVLDASVASPAPGDVLVTVLGRTGDGTASAGLLAAVAEALNDEEVRPLCDRVLVRSATIVPFAVTAGLRLFEGPDAGTVIAAARAAVEAYVSESHRLGRAVRRSALFRALHQEGVERVELTAPAADIEVSPAEAASCTAITLSEVTE
ncbi:Baseplate J family protein [Cereibacter sphaeroides WS8N]|uniref:baseplate assembly protein n=1 Tax=Cereibacter sphaeroides TaxID=1063 RepID=UPI00020B0338|nr:baseplate J/gp47 family protein [Cereibacter sphaeroides]EGJ20119.1 Baseplate J family protein [Cereibacter sphaeroides WS8N]